MFNNVALLSVFLFSINCALASSTATVLNHYPQCDYELLETVTEDRKLTQQDGRLAQEFVDQAFRHILDKFLQRAVEIGAQGILLVDRNIEIKEKESWTKNRDSYTLVSYTAELIKLCVANPNLSKKAAPFSAQGKPQKVLQLGTIKGWQQQIEIALPSNRQRLKPDLQSSLISLKEGMYGIRLGTLYPEVIAKFGTPTFTMPIDQVHRMIAYGRDHWLIFKDQKLVQTRSSSPYFSSEFTNLLAFDERFEQQQWELQGKLKRGDSGSAAASLSNLVSTDEDKIVLSDGQNELYILLDKYNHRNAVAEQTKVTGFWFTAAGFKLPKLANIDHSQLALKRIAEYLQDQDRGQLTFEMLQVAPLAAAYMDSTSDFLLLGPHLIVERTGTDLSKIRFLENVYNDATKPAKSNWQFNGISQGQDLESVLGVLGDDAFHFDDLIEYTGDAFNQRLYFYPLEGKLRLITSEISIY